MVRSGNPNILELKLVKLPPYQRGGRTVGSALVDAAAFKKAKRDEWIQIEIKDIDPLGKKYEIDLREQEELPQADRGTFVLKEGLKMKWLRDRIRAPAPEDAITAGARVSLRKLAPDAIGTKTLARGIIQKSPFVDNYAYIMVSNVSIDYNIPVTDKMPSTVAGYYRKHGKELTGKKFVWWELSRLKLTPEQPKGERTNHKRRIKKSIEKEGKKLVQTFKGKFGYCLVATKNSELEYHGPVDASVKKHLLAARKTIDNLLAQCDKKAPVKKEEVLPPPAQHVNI